MNIFLFRLEAIHRIQNPGKKPVKIIEAQVGSILKETDIVRFRRCLW
jgi:mannose-6-phosphate isomerase-like protein (cupin superfamily)